MAKEKYITIKEGGTDVNLTAEKIVTQVTGGGTQGWIPEDAYEFGTLRISKNNKVFRAEDSEYSAWNKVIVNIDGLAGKKAEGEFF